MLKKLPLPVTGVALGTAALGNLIESYSAGARLICGAVSFLLLICFLIKICLYPRLFREDMKNPVMASVFCTFSMTVILLAGYLKPFIGSAAVIIWYAGIVIHFILILYFTKTFMLKPVISNIFASYFIVYVGVAAASVTAPAFGTAPIGQALFWFCFCMLLLFLIIITYRYRTIRQVPDMAKPLFCIYTAPASLCLAGYIQSFPEKSMVLAVFLSILSFVLYVLVLVKLPGLLRMPFYPSYAAFTFPFVISAIGMKMMNNYLVTEDYHLPVLNYIILIQAIIACILVIYTLIRYIMFLLTK